MAVVHITRIHVDVCVVSSQGDVALEVVHVVEEVVPGQAPSKEQILSRLVVKAADVASLTATNVDLDFAVKGLFKVSV